MERWHTLPLSLDGLINLLKMNIVPKIIYFFQNFPIFISKKKFNSLDQMFSNFNWDGKQPWISKAFLQRPKTSGGMSLPNVHYYYWACNIQKVIAHTQSILLSRRLTG